MTVAKAGVLAAVLLLAAGISAGPWITDEAGAGDLSLATASAATNDPPEASFTATCEERDCTFDGSGSSDSDGSIASYHWDFGDGDTAGGETVSHTYNTDGDYTVTLTVTDDDGATDQATKTITAEDNDRPVASFSGYCDELQCSFDGSASYDPDGSIAEYHWDFGDGNTALGVQVEHTYDTGGSYEVVLTVTDDDGATATYRLTFDAFPPQETMHVHSIEHSASGLNVQVQVSVFGDRAEPVNNAVVQVETCNTVVVCQSATRTTGSDGLVTFTWEFGTGGLFETCVLDLDHPETSYQPSEDHADDGNCARETVVPGWGVDS